MGVSKYPSEWLASLNIDNRSVKKQTSQSYLENTLICYVNQQISYIYSYHIICAATTLCLYSWNWFFNVLTSWETNLINNFELYIVRIINNHNNFRLKGHYNQHASKFSSILKPSLRWFLIFKSVLPRFSNTCVVHIVQFMISI